MYKNLIPIIRQTAPNIRTTLLARIIVLQTAFFPHPYSLLLGFFFISRPSCYNLLKGSRKHTRVNGCCFTSVFAPYTTTQQQHTHTRTHVCVYPATDTKPDKCTKHEHGVVDTFTQHSFPEQQFDRRKRATESARHCWHFRLVVHLRVEFHVACDAQTELPFVHLLYPSFQIGPYLGE